MMNKIFKLASAFKMKYGSPMKQVAGPGDEETDEEFDKRSGMVQGSTKAMKALDAKNESRNFTEAMAKNDSVVAANKRMKINVPGESKEEKVGKARRAGNAAANDTRQKYGMGHAKVDRFTQVDHGGTLDSGNVGKDKYVRQYLPERELTYDTKSKTFGSQGIQSNTSVFGDSFTKEKRDKATAYFKKK
jgi:hypothetical protein